MQCLVCGENRPVLERLQSKVKGIPGGQTSGTSVISANSDAFRVPTVCKQSQVAPICQECAEGFTRGLNDLLASESKRNLTERPKGSQRKNNAAEARKEAYRIMSNNGAFVFWTREVHGFDFGTVSTPEPEHVKALLETVRLGRWTDLDETDFYALSLSAAGGRAVVRDWLNTTVRHVTESLARWFQRQRIGIPQF